MELETDIDDVRSQNIPVRHRTPGPKPLDIGPILDGRDPVFTNDYTMDPTFLKRNDYLLGTEGLLEKCITTGTIESRLGRIFSHLYGSEAPEKFQSIIMYDRKVYVVDEINESGQTSIAEYSSIHAYLSESTFYKEFLDSVSEFCRNAIRRGGMGLEFHLNHVYDFINKGGNGELLLVDVCLRSDAYEKYRRKYPDIVRNAKKFTNVLAHEIGRTAITRADRPV
jgi:hypothetical protein